MLSNKQLHILQHTLGLNEYGQGDSYRNHYVASEGHSEYGNLLKLVELGLMVRREPCAVSDEWFSVTAAGKEAIKSESPKPPKLTRSQLRYQRYLEYGDCFDSFRDFLGWDADPAREWNQHISKTRSLIV